MVPCETGAEFIATDISNVALRHDSPRPLASPCRRGVIHPEWLLPNRLHWAAGVSPWLTWLWLPPWLGISLSHLTWAIMPCPPVPTCWSQRQSQSHDERRAPEPRGPPSPDPGHGYPYSGWDPMEYGGLGGPTTNEQVGEIERAD